MSDIQRFTLYTNGIRENDSGKWVEYEEHLAIVEKLKARIKTLTFELEEAKEDAILGWSRCL